MLTKEDIRDIIEECRQIGASGLRNGIKADIPEIKVDILKPPRDFLGVNGNPAIFINQDTYKLLGSIHRNWILNKTIALKPGFLLKNTIDIIGIIIHETGHAFNVAAKIDNTEANAYIFEIEVLLKLLETDSPLLFGCTKEDVGSFFKTRLPDYNKGQRSNRYLANLIDEIKDQFKLEEIMLPPAETPKEMKRGVPTIFVTSRYTLFAVPTDSYWGREYNIVMSKINAAL